MALTSENRKVAGKRVLIIGNSPAAKMVDWASLPSDVITIGLNRIADVCGRDVGLGFWPTFLMVVDDTVEANWIAPEGLVEGFISIRKCKWHEGRRDLLEFELGRPSVPHKWQWPRTLDDPLIWASNTACYAFQLCYLWRAAEVALIGVDHNTLDLKKAGKLTHHYGENHAAPGVEPMPDQILSFWCEALRLARELGFSCVNLSPFDDAPFHRAGWKRESWTSYCRRTEPLAPEAARG